MMSTVNAGWELLLKRMAAGLHRVRPGAAAPLVSFSSKRQTKLGWTLFLCSRNR